LDNEIFDTKVFEGKTAFISGATGGIGKSVALALAKCGCDLFLTGKDHKKLEALIDELSVFDIHIQYFPGNLLVEEDIYKIIHQAKKAFPSIDIIINSAGIFPNEMIFEVEDDDYGNAMDINFKSAFMFIREFARGMVKRKWGRIVNIGSSSAYGGFAGTSIYCASKHALLGFSRAIHDELKADNVRTLYISPSSTQSNMGLATKGQDYSTFLDPYDVAKYVVFAISFESNIVSEEIFLKRMLIR
jgi:3-oxoacyl-[acyl-carrier protein] reductase